MSNEDFLENEDNLFVQTRVPHDDLHELVKYGDHPIYQGLKDDQSRAWIKKSLFEKLDYQTKINCVKEEAMAIALERYLIPMISNNQENSYKLALIRICTTLTKGWFRQFAIDNYPRLANLDKDLLSIANNIIEKFPVKQKKPDVILLDPETQAIFESIRPYTTISYKFEDYHNNDDNDIERTERTGINITSPCKCAGWSASVVILPTNDFEILSDDDEDENSFAMDDVDFSFKVPLKIHPYKNLVLISWGVGDDVWRPIRMKANSADYVASLLEIPDLTGDLLFKYVLDYLKPTLICNGETPLKQWVNKLKVEGAIPMEPKQHLWYYAWNYELNRKSKKSNYRPKK
ncbi:unnamed protein product [Rhizophagus irregularis]|nr:unnamed protein product [Rhizophagus irregularis]